jgi:hypothetical protein
MFGTTTAFDLSPGYRVEGTFAGANNLYCCKVFGKTDAGNTVCETKTCAGAIQESYSAYVSVGNVFRDCFAQYVARMAALLVQLSLNFFAGRTGATSAVRSLATIRSCSWARR